MSFAADWLALREPADRRARAPGPLAAFATDLSRHEDATVTDLACGTGATMRAVSSRVPTARHWRLVDADAALLEVARAQAGDHPALDVVPVLADLATELDTVMALPAHAVTTSAFLDLVSADWLARLVRTARTLGRPVYAALTYDGRVACTPVDPRDAEVLAAFDLHQRRDKGLGGALGPAAAAQAEAQFRAAGFDVFAAHADWVLDAGQAALQAELVDGWRRAVAETGRVAASTLDAWHRRRVAAIAEGRSRLVVGHLDLYARPPGGAPVSRPSTDART